MKRICLNRSVLDFMDSILTPDSYVVEFGAGYSSKWFAQRCRKLLSVETDRGWAETAVVELAGSDCVWRVQQVRTMREVEFDYESPDLVLIDCVEKLRDAATRVAWPRVKRGGWLVFDDAQRPRHYAAISRLGAPDLSLGWQPGDIETARERVALAWMKP